MKLKLKHLNYSRNGMRGNSFYTAHIELEGESLIATFETVENFDSIVIATTCRVVNPLKPFEDYRGDEIGHALSKLVDSTDFYDLVGPVKYPELYPNLVEQTQKRLEELSGEADLIPYTVIGNNELRPERVVNGTKILHQHESGEWEQCEIKYAIDQLTGEQSDLLGSYTLKNGAAYIASIKGKLMNRANLKLA